METLLTPRWPFLLVRGIASLAFGVAVLKWPGVTLAAVTLLFGVYAFADGLIALGIAAKRGKTPHRWSLVVDGLVGLGAGIATLVSPGMTLLALVLLVGARFLLAGVSQIATSVALRHELDAPVLYGIAGFASVLLGLVTFVVPSVTALALVTFIGVYALVFGVAMSLLSLRLRKVAHASAH